MDQKDPVDAMGHKETKVWKVHQDPKENQEILLQHDWRDKKESQENLVST